MKVRVTYTVNYEDVPDVVNELLTKCREQLKRASQFKFNILNLEKAAAEFGDLQKDLDTVSTQLEDCLNLSRGYVDVQRGVVNDLEAAANNTEEATDEENG